MDIPKTTNEKNAPLTQFNIKITKISAAPKYFAAILTHNKTPKNAMLIMMYFNPYKFEKHE